MARNGLRMIPTFPSPSLECRTAGFPQYGYKAGLSDGAFPRGTYNRVARFASVLRALHCHRRFPRTVPRRRCAFEHHRSSDLHRFAPGALAPTWLCSPGLHRLTGPIRPTRHLVTASLPSRLCVASLLCRAVVSARPRPMTTGSRLSNINPS